MIHHFEEVATGLAYAHGKIVHFYYVGEPGGPWMLAGVAIAAVRRHQSELGLDEDEEC